MKKLKDIDILRRFMLYHRKPKKPTANSYYSYREEGDRKMVTEIVPNEQINS